MNHTHDKIVEVEYEHADEKPTSNDLNAIKGEDNIRYSATQVAEIFDLPVSKIRYYAKAFERILDLEFSNKMRKFTKSSVDKLRYILKLKEDDGMTVQQILDYCEREDVFTEQGLNVNNTNPLPVNMLTEAIMLELKSAMKDMKDEIVREVVQQVRESNIALTETVTTTVDEVVSEKLDEVSSSNKHISQTLETVSEKIDNLKQDNLDKYIDEFRKPLEVLQAEVIAGRKAAVEQQKEFERKWAEERKAREEQANNSLLGKIRNVFHK